jgi:predicted dehydrogenase
MKPLRIAVLGYGYWGPHIARNISQIPVFSLAAIIDRSSDRLDLASKKHPDVPKFRSLEDALESTKLDAIVIATPTHTHFQLTLQVLEAGLHVLVEKPITTSTKEALELSNLAKRQSRILMVDHTFLYTPAVSKLKEIVDSTSLGDLIYFDSMRVNLGIFQPDVSVLWDLAVHDIAILLYVTGLSPISVNAIGGMHRDSKHEAAMFLTLQFQNLFFAHINVSWLSPMKIRHTVLSGSQKTVLFDDMSNDEKIRIYDASVDYFSVEDLLRYRLGDLHIPRLDGSEALSNELRHFHDCIIGGIEPHSSGHSAVEIIAILEAAQKSAENQGRTVTISDQSFAA